MKDPKKLNIPNINFSLTNDDDKREKEYSKQRIKRGFDDSELWSLRDTIGRFILPRLKQFKKVTTSYPAGSTMKQWQDILEKIIISFELLTRDNGSFILTDEELMQFDEGMNLFNDYFMDLWW